LYLFLLCSDVHNLLISCSTSFELALTIF
jgi:hypothetical protein